MSNTELELCSQHSFERSLSPSIGYMLAENEAGERVPIEVITTSIKGSISNYIKKASEVEKKVLDPNNANLQQIDIAFLPEGYDRLVVKCNIVFKAASLRARMINDPIMDAEQERFARLMREKGAYHALAQAYLQNILNLRWLWTNRYGIDHRIKVNIKGREGWLIDMPVDYELNTDYSGIDGYDEILNKMVEALTVEQAPLILRIEGSVVLEEGQEVHPSQEMILDERAKKNGPSRVLYSIRTRCAQRQGGLHPQKIGNAIRTIDIWYPDYKQTGIPLAVEAYGVNNRVAKAFRAPLKKKDFYSLIKKLPQMNAALETATDATEVDQAMYVLAVFVRGGVFSA